MSRLDELVLLWRIMQVDEDYITQMCRLHGVLEDFCRVGEQLRVDPSIQRETQSGRCHFRDLDWQPVKRRKRTKGPTRCAHCRGEISKGEHYIVVGDVYDLTTYCNEAIFLHEMCWLEVEGMRPVDGEDQHLYAGRNS